MKQPIYSLKNLIKTGIKLLVKVFLYPFVDAEFYLKRRGNSPIDSQILEFTNVVKLLKN